MNKAALVILFFPYLWLLLFYLDFQFFGNKTQMLFIALFFLILLPCSILSLYLFHKKYNYENQPVITEITRIFVLLFGILGIIFGIIGWALVYVFTTSDGIMPTTF